MSIFECPNFLAPTAIILNPEKGFCEGYDETICCL
jgi:hypothetical protein